MKKKLTAGIVFFVVSILLLIDALRFRFCIEHGVGDGTGLYLFLGTWEINDTIPYTVAPNYLYTLYVIIGLLFALSVYLIYRAVNNR